MHEDDVENARAALRALWAASGQMEDADSLGKERDATARRTHEGDIRSANNDGKGGLGGDFGSDRHNEIGFAAFADNNEPTFDRGEAATKFREAWKSQLALDGKLGTSKSVTEAAEQTREELKAGARGGGKPDAQD